MDLRLSGSFDDDGGEGKGLFKVGEGDGMGNVPDVLEGGIAEMKNLAGSVVVSRMLVLSRGMIMSLVIVPLVVVSRMGGRCFDLLPLPIPAQGGDDGDGRRGYQADE
jgi:hypothetical protein